jgi:hypothetical protein
MDIRWIFENVIFRGLGVSLITAAFMLALMTAGVRISERMHRLATGIALTPLLALVVLIGAALVQRGLRA